jgi:hypothetical protein
LIGLVADREAAAEADGWRRVRAAQSPQLASWGTRGQLGSAGRPARRNGSAGAESVCRCRGGRTTGSCVRRAGTARAS